MTAQSQGLMLSQVIPNTNVLTTVNYLDLLLIYSMLKHLQHIKCSWGTGRPRMQRIRGLQSGDQIRIHPLYLTITLWFTLQYQYIDQSKFIVLEMPPYKRSPRQKKHI